VIEELVAKEKETIIAWRRQIHQHPELGFQEHNTGKMVGDLLEEFGYEVQRGIGGTGVVGILRPQGMEHKRAVALRADMDALTVTEENQVPYASKNPGVMHACGHDGHTAMLLGAAKVLSQLRDQLSAPIVVLFQPAEERLGGARAVLADGFFQQYSIGEIFGLHLWPQVPKGKVGLKVGPVMAGSIDFKLKVLGQQAHASEPHNSIDTIVAGAAIVGALQAISSRFINPLESVVVSVGTFHAGEISNVIPGEALLSGTARTASQNVYKQLPALLERVIESTARTYGARVELEIVEGYPVTASCAESVATVEQVTREALGEEGLFRLDSCRMASEDFSYYLQEVPGAYFFLGLGNERKLHQPTFDFDEELLAVGAEILARTALAASKRQDSHGPCRN